MITTNLYLNITIYISIAYLLGSIPSAVWVGKWFFNIDIRTKGSGSAGATNTIRVLGLKAGIPVLLFDSFKGWFAVFLGTISNINLTGEYFALFLVSLSFASVLGHVFPIFAGFRGGKGVATLLGIAIALFPYEIMILVGIFLLVFLLFQYVSLASITASICFPFVSYFIVGTNEMAYIIFAVLVSIFVPLTHIKNIKRLLRREEKKLKFKRTKN